MKARHKNHPPDYRDMMRFRASPNFIYSNLDNITRVVCRHFGMTATQIKTATRKRGILEPRQIAMYLCKLKTKNTLEEIGAYFGFDHATVSHSFKVISDLMKYDQELAATVEQIRLKL